MATLTDSIAVSVLDPHNVLQGVGNQLKHYRAIAGAYQCSSYDLLFEDKIHGIEAAPDGLVYIYGRRYLALCKFHAEDEKPFRIISSCKLGDCISSASVSPSTEKTLNLVTTYNVAVEVKVNEKDCFEITRKSVCERSTLYCSHIRQGENGTWTEVTIFGGTALGEVLIWSPTNEGHSSIAYRFSAPRGVIFSISTNADLSEIFTTSDDRSVRFWSLGRNEGRAIVRHSLKLTSFGHTGRVFRSTLANYKGTVYLVTIGEDSRICCWDMQGRLRFRREIQSGASLWNVVVDKDAQVIYVTTSNGGLEVLSMAECLREVHMECISKDLFPESYPAKIRFLSATRIICLTSSNELLLIGASNGVWSTIASIRLDFKSTVLEVSGNFIALGGHGRIAIYKNDGDSLDVFSESAEVLKGLVRAVQWIDGHTILAVNNAGEGTVLDIFLKEMKRLSIPEDWSTSVLAISHHIVVADRHGDLNAFNGTLVGDSNECPLMMTLKRLHGNYGVTEMKAISSDRFTTLGHDGMIRTIRLDESKGRMEIQRSQKVPIKWIERTDGDLLLGFNDNHFTIYSQRDKRITAEVDCGGGHRFWDFIRDGDAGRFLFIKNRQLQLVDIPLNSSSNPLPHAISHWHINSTNCLAVWNVQDRTYLISGGEEGLIKIHELSQENHLIYRDELTSHISNIRSLFVRKVTDQEILLFSGGGRAQLCIHRLRVDEGALEVWECVNFMLKGSDLDRRRKCQNKEVDFDPETRLMCLHVDRENRIYVGCSDGYIRLFRWDNSASGLILISELFYGRCILHVTGFEIEGSHILLTAGTDGKINFWRDDLVEKSQPIFSTSHHESGIIGMDWRVLDDGSLWIVTGGDDQGIVGTRLKFDSASFGFTETARIEFPFRHSAQVTGIRFINDKEFLSIGLDQQLLRHSLGSGNSYEKVKFTSIADVKGLALASPSQAVLYGCGVDVMWIKSEINGHL